MRYLIMIFSGIFFTFGLNAQKTWTLKDCIEHAYSNNLTLKEYKLNAVINENQLKQSKADIFPNLNAGASQTYSFGRSVDPFTNEFATENVRSDNYYINSSVTLFQGFQKVHNIRKYQYDLKSNLVLIEAVKNDMAINITSAYLQVLFEIELVRQAEDQLALTIDQYNLTKEKVEAGSLARGKLYELESMQGNDEYNLILAKNRYEIAVLNLKQMLELEHTTDFDILIPDDSISIEPFPYSVNDVYLTALERQPAIVKTQYDLESAREGFAIARSYYFPTLSLNGRYGTGYSDARQQVIDRQQTGTQVIGWTASNEDVFAPSYRYVYETSDYSDQLKNNASTSIYFSLNIPIFNNYQTSTLVSNARLEMERAELKVELAKNELYKDIQLAITDVRSASQKYNASLKNLASNEETYRYYKEKFDLGMVTYVELKDAKNQLFKARSDYLQSKFEYLLKLKIIKYYMGESISD